MGTATKIEVASADGTVIRADRIGTGPPLVAVHGATADRSRWAGVVPLLSGRRTLYLMDRRGRGDSGDTEPYSLDREVEDVVAVVESARAAAGEPVILLGHSFGGLCSAEAVLRTGDVRALLLYEPGLPIPGRPIAPPELLGRMRAMLAAGDRDGMLSTFMREAVGLDEATIDSLRPTPLWAARIRAAHTITREIDAVAGYRFDPDRFAGLSMPVRLLLGGDSPTGLRAATEAMQSAVSHADLVVLPGQGHIAMDTAPRMFADAVLAFGAGSDGA